MADKDFARQWGREMAAEYARLMAEAEEMAQKSLAEFERLATEAARDELQSAPIDEEPDLDIGPQRSEWVPQQLEGRYVRRGDDGLPELRLERTGDRLSVWSPLEGGAFINTRGVGLRRIGLYSCHVRGTRFFEAAYTAADLSPGKWVRLMREPDNSHDPHAVQIHAEPDTGVIGYVQHGRAKAVAKRLDAGEDICGVVLRGAAVDSGDNATWLILGARADLHHMLKS